MNQNCLFYFPNITPVNPVKWIPRLDPIHQNKMCIFLIPILTILCWDVRTQRDRKYRKTTNRKPSFLQTDNHRTQPPVRQKRNASSKSPQAHVTMLHACYMNVACSGNFRRGYSSSCVLGDRHVPLFCSYIETETVWLNKTSGTSFTPSSDLTSSPSSIVEMLMVWHQDFLGGSKAYEQLEIFLRFLRATYSARVS